MSWTPISNDLRQLEPRELAVGRVTLADILDRHGRVVLEKGTRFGAEHAWIVKKYGFEGLFVGPDWPPPRCSDDVGALTIDPDELMQSLQRKAAARGGALRVRGQARHGWSQRITVVEVAKLAGAVIQRRIEVTTQDLSRSGFAFVAPHFVYEGTVLYASFGSLPGRPVMKAIVRNCQLGSGRDYRVGAEFVPLESGEIPPI
jgi:hypothetical protein